MQVAKNYSLSEFTFSQYDKKMQLKAAFLVENIGKSLNCCYMRKLSD